MTYSDVYDEIAKKTRRIKDLETRLDGHSCRTCLWMTEPETGEHCGDCIHWTPTNDASDYGQCKYHKGHLDHKGTSACKKIRAILCNYISINNIYERENYDQDITNKRGNKKMACR